MTEAYNELSLWVTSTKFHFICTLAANKTDIIHCVAGLREALVEHQENFPTICQTGTTAFIQEELRRDITHLTGSRF